MDKQTIKEKVFRPIIDNGFQCYFVGGCVRDQLLKKEPKDFDLVTDATPRYLHKIFSCFIDKNSEQYGITVISIDQEPIEIATLRTENLYEDYRHPTRVNFTWDIKEDAIRRDFTINALYEDTAGNIFDPTGLGLSDLKHKILRFIGNLEDRLQEDHLRTLRYCRFISQLGFTTNQSFFVERDFLDNISNERIGEELRKLFGGNSVVRGIITGCETGVFNTSKIDLSEIIGRMQLEKQRPDYHYGDVWLHTQMALEKLQEVEHDWIDMMSVFFHDVGKPIAGVRNGRVSGALDYNNHVGHEKDSAQFFKDWVNSRPGLMSNKDRDIIYELILNHSRVGRIGEIRDKYKLFEIVSNPLFSRMTRLSLADRLAHKKTLPYPFDEALQSPDVIEMCKRVNEPKKVTGNDLIKNGVKPGPLFKKMLHVAFKTQIKFPELTKEKLLQTALSVKE